MQISVVIVTDSRLARQIYALKKQRNLVTGPFVEVNCAMLRGDTAMATLFGHWRGAFTGATADRPGLLKTADAGRKLFSESRKQRRAVNDTERLRKYLRRFGLSWEIIASSER